MNKDYLPYAVGFMAGYEPTIIHQDMLNELRKARKKFPTREFSDNEDLLAMLAALNEEIGELNAAIIQYLYEPEKESTIEHIRKETAQCGAMLIRVCLDTRLGLESPHGRGVY